MAVTTTYYSKVILGDKGNYSRKVRFDKTGGYVGITQYDSQDAIDRVLLSRAQVEKLFEFLRPKKRRRKP